MNPNGYAETVVTLGCLKLTAAWSAEAGGDEGGRWSETVMGIGAR